MKHLILLDSTDKVFLKCVSQHSTPEYSEPWYNPIAKLIFIFEKITHGEAFY